MQLATYLSANPSACDSADGIAHWWLPDLATDAAGRAALDAGLDFLQQSGLIDCVRAADGRARWRRSDADPGFDARVRAALAAAAPAPGGGPGGAVH